MLENIKAVTFELTNACDLQCKICSIWKEKSRKELPLLDIKKFWETQRNPVSVSLTGGEPLFHSAFERVYKFLFSLYLRKKVKGIDIATNAYSSRILEFIKRHKAYLAPLSLSISLDGLEACHNAQRGRADAFANTLAHIIEIRRYKIPVNLKFVITKINFSNLYMIYRLAEKIGCAFYPKFFENVPHYYHRAAKPAPLSLSGAAFDSTRNTIDSALRLERRKNGRTLTYFSLSCLARYMQQGNLQFIKMCRTPSCALFITCKGDIYSCISQKRIGTIRNYPVINEPLFHKICEKALAGNCPRCLAYHGFLRGFNLEFLPEG